MKLKWWHKQLAFDVVLAKHRDEWLVRHWTKFGLTKSKLNKIKRDYDFLEFCKGVEKDVRDQVINGRMRINRLASGRAIDTLEEELELEPWNPETGEGDKNYDHKVKVDTAKDVIKMSDVQLGKDEKAQGDIIIRLITDKEEKKEDKGGDGSNFKCEPTSKTLHRD